MKSAPLLKHFYKFAAIFGITLCALAGCGHYGHCASQNERQFSHFSLILPEGWDGEERAGFLNDDNPDEYLLTVGKKDEAGERFLAQVSIFLLPNRPGATAREAALRLAAAQAGSTEPRQEGNFQVFTGEPRTRALSGPATTMVNTTPENMLIIIAQDPDGLGAREIVESLAGIGQRARELLGR